MDAVLTEAFTTKRSNIICFSFKKTITQGAIGNVKFRQLLITSKISVSMHVLGAL